MGVSPTWGGNSREIPLLFFHCFPEINWKQNVDQDPPRLHGQLAAIEIREPKFFFTKSNKILKQNLDRIPPRLHGPVEEEVISIKLYR